MNARPDELPPLTQRLRAVADVLLDPAPAVHPDPYSDAGILLDALATAVAARPGEGRLWLLLVGLTGEFPLHEDVEDVRRMLELTDQPTAVQRLLELTLPTVVSAGDMGNTIEVVTDRPIVDVHFTARADLLTGIQRVVRNTVPRWMENHDLHLSTWTPSGTALRQLSRAEEGWLLDHGVAGDEDGRTAPMTVRGAASSRLLVPWQVPVVLPEVPMLEHVFRLAALARHSGSPVALICYDCIPVISAELVIPEEHAKFISYLNVVKYAQRAVCISAAAAEEFAGFVDMLAAQGLSGPEVRSCPLPNGADIGEAGPRPEARPGGDGAPSVVCVGSIDRRKNQVVLLEAAERLWREGLSFRLRFLGSGGSAPPDFTAWCEELIATGRPITVEAEVSDAVLADAIGTARFTAFLSLHEGFGLPIAESLALGVPVLAADLGSMREIAADDGAVLVDPRDVGAVADAMRRLLTDDALVGSLRRQALDRPRRTWDEYAEQSWHALVGTDAS